MLPDCADEGKKSAENPNEHQSGVGCTAPGNWPERSFKLKCKLRRRNQHQSSTNAGKKPSPEHVPTIKHTENKPEKKCENKSHRDCPKQPHTKLEESETKGYTESADQYSFRREAILKQCGGGTAVLEPFPNKKLDGGSLTRTADFTKKLRDALALLHPIKRGYFLVNTLGRFPQVLSFGFSEQARFLQSIPAQRFGICRFRSAHL